MNDSEAKARVRALVHARLAAKRSRAEQAREPAKAPVVEPTLVNGLWNYFATTAKVAKKTTVDASTHMPYALLDNETYEKMTEMHKSNLMLRRDLDGCRDDHGDLVREVAECKLELMKVKKKRPGLFY